MHSMVLFNSTIKASVKMEEITNHKAQKRCGVCDEQARCYHFGGLCCESCKAFFRRSVFKDQYKQYRCIYGGNCKIDITTRKNCSHCRLKACLSIGMDKKWLMSEALRAELKKKAMKKMAEQNMVNEFGVFSETSAKEDKLLYLSSEQLREIEQIVYHCEKAFTSVTIPNYLEGCLCHESNVQRAVIFATCISRTMNFLQSIPYLQRLDGSNQVSLLKNRLMESLIVLGSLTFDPLAKAWIPNGKTLMNEPKRLHFCVDDFEMLHGYNATLKQFETMSSILTLGADREIVTILSLVAFFSLENETSPGSSVVNAIQEHFIDLLKRYVKWKFGVKNGEKMFTRFILKLSDVRESSDLHMIAKLSLSTAEIHEVEKRMGGITLLEDNTKTADSSVLQEFPVKALLPTDYMKCSARNPPIDEDCRLENEPKLYNPKKIFLFPRHTLSSLKFN